MDLVRFYIWFARTVEFLLIFPVLIGFIRWRFMPLSVKFVLFSLLAELLINFISEYLATFLNGNNLFLFYYYSFVWNIFILGFILHFTPFRKVVIFLMVLGCVVIPLEYRYFGVAKEMNYYSGFLVNAVIFLLSLYHFYFLFSSMKGHDKDFNSPILIILLGLFVQFFFRTVDIFIKKHLFQNQFYSVLWYYETIIYYYVMLMAIGIYSYSFYSLKNEN